MRVALSILAVIFDACLIVVSLLAAIGFTVDMSRGALTASGWVGFGIMVLAGFGAVVNIVAIAIGARLPRRATADAVLVASEFS